MRISDWSSDVCSSDLVGAGRGDGAVGEDAVLVAELDLFAHRVGWVVLVDGPVLIEVDHWRDPGVRSEPGQPVLDQAQELGSESAGVDHLRVGVEVAAQGADDVGEGEVQVELGGDVGPGRGDRRSEEHTSELKSLMRIPYSAFFLKKKKIRRNK